MLLNCVVLASVSVIKVKNRVRKKNNYYLISDQKGLAHLCYFLSAYLASFVGLKSRLWRLHLRALSGGVHFGRL